MNNFQAYTKLIREIKENPRFPIIILNGCFSFDDFSDQEFHQLQKLQNKFAKKMARAIIKRKHFALLLSASLMCCELNADCLQQHHPIKTIK